MKVYLKGIGFKDYRRTYSPVYDSKVYDKEAWEKLLEDFNKNVKVGTYSKLPYADWKVLHLMDGDYKVVWFEIDNVYLAPTVAHIQEFKYLKDSDSFRMVGTDKKYDTSEAYSFGAYLADMLFYDYFDCTETTGRVDDYRLFGLDNLGAYDPEDNIGWRAINWALNPAVEGTTGQVIFSDVKKDIKKLNCEFDKTTEILNNCYNEINKNAAWFNKVYEDVDRIKNTTCSDTATINVSPIDPAKLDIKDETVSTASVSIDWGYRPTDSTDSSITGGSVIGKTIEVNGDSGITYNPYTTATISICDNLTSRIDTMEERINKLETNNDDVKGKGNNMKMFNFDFGPIKDNDAVRMSPYGLAVKNVNGTYQAYDKKNGEIMDVDVFNFKADNMFFKMPVGIDAVGAGDLIVFNRKPCFVFGFSEQGDVIVIDIALGEKKTILPTKSPFGNFTFITKIVSLFDNMMTPPSNDNPLGNMWMFAFLDNDNKSMKDILPMMMLMNGTNNMSNFNPMMFYFMSDKTDGDKDWLLPMLMMNNFSGKTN